MRDYPTLLRELLVMEHSKSEDEAARLVKKHTQIVLNGIMGGLTFPSIRACAVAIEIAESEEREANAKTQEETEA